MDKSNETIINIDLDNINIEPHYVNLDDIYIPPKPIIISNDYMIPIYVELESICSDTLPPIQLRPPSPPPPQPPPYYDYDIIHELKECCCIAIERCNFPCCLFSILSLCIGCVNIISMICNCSYCIKLEIKIGLNIIIRFCILISIFIIFILCVLFIIYGIKNTIYYNLDGFTFNSNELITHSSPSFNSNVWIIIEGISHIIYCIYIVLLLFSHTDIIFYLGEQKKTKIINICIILCKIIWTFLGLLFIVNIDSKDHNMTYTIIKLDIIIINIIQFIILLNLLYFYNKIN